MIQAAPARRAIFWLGFLGMLGAFSIPASGQESRREAVREAADAIVRMDERTEAGVLRGLEFLARRQNDDGSFGTSATRGNAAICALAGMAFMSHGDVPGRGPFGENVSRCVRYLLANAESGGFIASPESGTHGPMYGHGFATLFLAEAYGMSSDPAIRDTLQRAVKLIVNTQNQEGGWRYYPERREADISVTICQVMALRSARNAGIFVPNETIDQCIEYVKRSQNADGGFMYQLSRPGESMFPRSAAGVVALYSAGIYSGDEIERGHAYLLQYLAQPGGGRENYYLYGHYYAVQAMWQAGGESWNRWYPAIRDEILGRQTRDGAWPDSVGPDYGTAMACLILQTPNSYLPIFQR